MTRRKDLFTTACCVAAATVFVAQAQTLAANRYWIDTAGGPFAFSSNWSTTSGGVSGASVPGAADVAIFDQSGTYLVTFSVSSLVTNQALIAEGGNVTIDLNNSVYTLTNATAAQIGTFNGTGRLTLIDGALTSDSVNDADNLVIGNSGGSGFLTVTQGGRIGNGATRMDVTVGNSGFGSLIVSGNGQVLGEDLIVGSSDNGAMTISGEASWVELTGSAIVGSNSDGSLTIASGGSLTTGTSSNLGNTVASEANVLVTDAGSTWTTGSGGTFTIGISGLATVNVSSGGQVLTQTLATLGSSSTGSGVVNVSGEGSLWELGNQLEIANSGTGVLNVTDGGRVTGTSSVIADLTGSDGRATVSGGGQWFNSSFITVGDVGTGRLDITDGGEVSAGSLTLGGGAGGTGVANLSGAGSTFISPFGSVVVGNLGQGELNISDAAEMQALSMNIGSGLGTFNLDGGSVYVGNAFTNNGTLNFTNGLLRVGGFFQHQPVNTSLVIDGADITDLPTLDLFGDGGNINISAVTVGEFHRGRLQLRQGRNLNAPAGIAIGGQIGGEGSILVESGSVLTTPASLAVGGTSAEARGKGTLDIHSGGAVDVNALFIWPDGTVNLNNGTLEVGSFNASPGAQFNWTSGTLRFDSASTNITAALAPVILGADMTLETGQTLSNRLSTQTMSLAAPVTVAGGSIMAGNLNVQSSLLITAGAVEALNTTSNSATVTLANPLASFGGVSLNNDGTIRGEGRLFGATTNNTAGTIEVLAGDRMLIDGTLTNFGHVSVIGGELHAEALVSNVSALGLISARNAILRFDGGVSNAGGMAFSNGTVDVYGDIGQSVGGRITVTAGGIANFYDDVVVAPGAASVQASAVGSTVSSVVFFGSYNGGITGGGDAFIEGDHRPGNSPGQVTFTGNVSYGPFATLEVELGTGGVPGVSFDRVLVSKNLNLAGTLDIAMLGGFVPAIGNSFEILGFAGSRNGVFDRVLFPPLSGVGLGVVYEPNSVTLMAGLIGDLNFDGFVGIADLNIVLGNWNQGVDAGVWGVGDPTGDGFVGIADLNQVLGNWNAGTPPAGASSAVPEPGTLACTAALLSGLLVRRTHHRRRAR